VKLMAARLFALHTSCKEYKVTPQLLYEKDFSGSNSSSSQVFVRISL
jgi:hypothetical protein